MIGWDDCYYLCRNVCIDPIFYTTIKKIPDFEEIVFQIMSIPRWT